MDEKTFRHALRDLSMGDLCFYKQTGSTNDIALAWATEGAPDMSLVFADEQTSGRGRMGRKWVTLPHSALAFSLILRPEKLETGYVSLFSGLGALALAQALKRHGLQAQIKWPNDVLVNRRKLAGILVETVWTGEKVDSIVLGMGVNVLAGAVPPPNQVIFPATSVENEGLLVARDVLLHDILAEIIKLRAGMNAADFIADWENALAFRGEQVQVWAGTEKPLTGIVAGLGEDGALKLETSAGLQVIQFGEIHLRPL